MIDPSYFCPGCNVCLGCSCPSYEQEEHEAEEAYVRGHADGHELGATERPELVWLRSPINPDRERCPEDYLTGFDDGLAGRPNAVEEHYLRLNKQRQRERLSRERLALRQATQSNTEGPQAAAERTLTDEMPF